MKAKKIISLLVSATMLWSALPVSADENLPIGADENFNVDPALETEISGNDIEIAINEIYDTSAVISWNAVTDCVYEIRLNGKTVSENYKDLTYQFTNMDEGTEYNIDIRAFSITNNELTAEGSQIIHTNLYINNDKNIYNDTAAGNLSLLSGTLSLNGNTLTVENLTMSGGTLDLNGGTLKVTGNVTQTGGTMNVNGGKLLIDGSYSFPSDKPNYGYLKMTKADGYVLVGSDFTAGQYYSHKGYLTEGVLEIKGNFTQITTGSSENFSTSGNHKVILSGKGKQIVTFDSPESQFNILEVNKSLDNGYQFSRTPLWNELIEKETDKEAPTTPRNLHTTRVTSSAIVLKWEKSTDNVAVCGYYIYCNGKKIADVNALSYTHENLKSDSVYNYCIQAYDVELRQHRTKIVCVLRSQIFRQFV